MNAKVYLCAISFLATILLTRCCPEKCSCKWKNGKKMAECSQRGFISIPTGIEEETQMLDISGNDLQVLREDTFRNFGLVALQKMFMRSCSIGQIDGNAFRGLENLIEIDLSENLLTRVPSQAFNNIPYLRNISLSYNPIQKIEAFAFSAVPQLAKLDLSHCNIQSIRARAFDGLDVLDYLKLNHNQLEELSADAVKGLRRLRTIELHDNKWRCDCQLHELKLWMGDSMVHIPIPLFCYGGPERLRDSAIVGLDAEEFACKPSIRTESRHYEPSVGSNISIECRVEANPAAKISWFLDRVQLSNNSIYDGDQRLLIVENDDEFFEQRSRVMLRNVEESDAGDYLCVAENRAGTVGANFTLRPRSAAGGGLVTLSRSSINVITIVLGVLIVSMLTIIGLLVKKLTFSSYPEDEDDPKTVKDAEKNDAETCSQQSHDSEMRSESGKAFTVTSDLSYSRSLSDIGNPQFSNPDLISGTNMRDSDCITPLPVARPIGDYCQNWQNAYAMARAANAAGFNYDTDDRIRTVADTLSIASDIGEMFAHSRISNDYPSDYGLPILPEDAFTTPQHPCVKTSKLRQHTVPVSPPVYSGPTPSRVACPKPPSMRDSPAGNCQSYQSCGTDV